MSLSAVTPTYAFTNKFPPITVTGTANSPLLFKIRIDDTEVLVENYSFNSSGEVVIRGLGDILEKYFYDERYDIHYFCKTAFLIFDSEAQSLTKTVSVCFASTYLSAKLTPDGVRSMPLTRERTKITTPDAKEYLSFVSAPSESILCTINYLANGQTFATQEVKLYDLTATDTYATVDVSYSAIKAHLSATDIPMEWKVYKNLHGSNFVHYRLERKGSFPPTCFAFQNVFGAMESFVCKGICKTELQIERETGEIGGHAVLTHQDAFRSYTVNTGTMDELQGESLVSLLMSRNVLLLKDGDAIPVIVNAQNVSLHNFRSKLPSAEFTYSFTERNLTLYRYDRSRGIFDYTFDNSFN